MEDKAARVLIPVHSGTWFIELQRVARMCRRSMRYEPVLLFLTPYPHRGRDIETCRAEGITCMDESAGPAPGGRPRLAALMERWGLDALRELKERTAFAAAAIASVRPVLLVLAGDNPGYDTACFIRAAHDAGLRVVLVPSTMSNGLEEAEVYSKNPRYLVQGAVNRAAAALFPKWAREHNGKHVLRVPGDRVFAMELLGLAPPRPWTFNSGFADAIAVESDAMRAYYAEGGLQEQQLVETGSLANDALREALAAREERRRALCGELDLPPERPMLLAALPPDFLYLEGGRPECDFNRYDGLVQFWNGAIASMRRYNRVVCLHPSVSYDEFRHLETAGVRIARRPTAELIPLCDLYVASVSSTIRWAIACGVPVVNYDVYRYRYTDYLGVEGVLRTEEQAEFAVLLARFDAEPGFHESVRALQSAAAPHWGRLDGGTGARMLALFDRLAAPQDR